MVRKEFTVLVIEDDQNDEMFLRRALREVSVPTTVRLVKDGREAMEYLRGTGAYSDRDENPYPTFIITDLKMPRMNGLELLQWLRGSPECFVIPLVALTGSAHPRDIEAAYKAGVNVYLQKPSRTEDLKDLLERLFRLWTIAEVPGPPSSSQLGNSFVA